MQTLLEVYVQYHGTKVKCDLFQLLVVKVHQHLLKLIKMIKLIKRIFQPIRLKVLKDRCYSINNLLMISFAIAIYPKKQLKYLHTLSDRKLLAPDCSITFYRDRHESYAQYFKEEDQVTFCSDVE